MGCIENDYDEFFMIFKFVEMYNIKVFILIL